jgi:hypothetical protein
MKQEDGFRLRHLYAKALATAEGYGGQAAIVFRILLRISPNLQPGGHF